MAAVVSCRWVGSRVATVARDLGVRCTLSMVIACSGSAPHTAHSAAATSSAGAGETPQHEPAPEEDAAEEDGRHATRAAAREEKPAELPPPKSAPAPRTLGVRGITGSLTAFEVEQSMRTQQRSLLACVAERPRSLGHVAGDIAFHVDVDGQGKAERVLVTDSDLGYTPLEDCLTGVVAAAPFPVPAGAQRAEAEWRMSVDPLGRPAEPLESEEVQDTIARQSEATYESCKIGKGRRFLVHGYLGRGKLLPVTVRAPWRGPTQTTDDVDDRSCLAQALTQWTHWPKERGVAKVGFELRWVAAPPPPKKRARTKSHKR